MDVTLKKIIKEVDDIGDLLKSFSSRLRYTNQLSYSELIDGNAIIEKITKIKEFDFSGITYNGGASMKDFLLETERFVKDIIEEDEYRKDLELDEYLVQECYNKLMRNSKD